MSAAWSALIVGALGLCGVLATAVFGRRLASAEAELKRAEAARIRLANEVTAADELHEAAERAEAAHQETRLLRRQLADHEDAAERHEKWDQMMVTTVRAMRAAMQAAGIGQDIPEPPDPPPLRPR